MTCPDPRRDKLSRRLHEILGSDEVYFQKPESKKMRYPAVIYDRSDVLSFRADDKRYLKFDRYMVTFIHKDADNSLTDSFPDLLEYCEYDRTYKSEDLYHDVFTVYV